MLRLMLAFLAVGALSARADTTSFAYEGDVMPDSEPVGFIPVYECDYGGMCTEYIEDQHFVAEGNPAAGLFFDYFKWIAQAPEQPPSSLFIETRYRSNEVWGGSDPTTDGFLTIYYAGIVEAVYMQGDIALNGSWNYSVYPLPLGEFHTYRFESPDGQHFRITVNGVVLVEGVENQPTGPGLVFGSDLGGGGLIKDEWDYIRFGPLSWGEVLTAASPAAGYVDPRQDQTFGQPGAAQGLDRFTVTFDQPNGLYAGNISIASTAPTALWPAIEWVTRPDDDLGTTWEIRLDKPLPAGHRDALHHFDEAEAAQYGQVGATSVVEYGFLPGDVNQNGTVTPADILALVTAINSGATDPLLHDINRSGTVAVADILRLVQLLNGIGTQQPWNGVSLPDWP